MAHTDESIDTLISISGTLASIELALVAILVSKASMDHFEAIADEIFLLSSLGFLFVVVLGYLAQKRARATQATKLLRAAEWIFSASLATSVIGAVLMVYAAV